MAESDDNIVLRLLREIRAKQEEQDRRFDDIGGRARFERRVEDMKESVGHALGLSAHANVAYETTGQRLDRLTDELKGLQARIEKLENPR